MTTPADLMPCPLCGSTDLALDGGHGEERINCDCGLRLTVPYDPANRAAVAKWNNRSDAFRQMAEAAQAFDQARGMLSSALSDCGQLMDRATAAEAECAALRKLLIELSADMRTYAVNRWANVNPATAVDVHDELLILFADAIDAAIAGEGK